MFRNAPLCVESGNEPHHIDNRMKAKKTKSTTGAPRTEEPAQLPPEPAALSRAAKPGNKELALSLGFITEVTAKIDVGFGNQLYIRGQGDSLTWEKGMPLQCRDASTWVWSTRQAKDTLRFKLLLNDQIWAQGQDLVVQAGTRLETFPHF